MRVMFPKSRNLLSGKYRSLLILALLASSFTVLTSLALAQGNVLSDPPKEYGLTQGWYQGRQTFYYDFGANSTATEDGQSVVPAPIYVLVTGFDADGNPQAVPEQRNIVDVIPGAPSYSDLWQVTYVTVPEDYVANSITSADEILNGGYALAVTDIFVNCPVVPAGSTLAEGGARLVQGWYKGQEINYFDFGLNPKATAPIYAFVTGFDAEGNPQFVEGQHNVIDVKPGDEGYSAFWFVNLVQVPADYEANSITSVDEVLAAGYHITQPGLLVNCPVLRTAEAGPAELPTTGGVQPAFSLWAILMAAGATLVGLGLFLRTRSCYYW